MNHYVRHGLIGLGLLALVAVAMGLACGHDFINLDDGPYVFANPKVQLGLSAENIEWALTTTHMGYWMPLTWLSLQLDATLFWPDDDWFEPRAATAAAWGFHLTNLLFHAANVCFFYTLLVQMTGSVGRSAIAAALFAVHPLHVESVVWITERKDVLSTFFLLLTMLAYVRFARSGNWLDYLATCVCFLLGLASKPMLVTLPCVLFLLDFWPLGRLQWGQACEARARPVTLPAALLEKLPLFAMAIVFALVTMREQYVVGAVSTALPLEVRAATALHGYGWYLLKTFWPSDLGLAYPLRILPLSAPEVWLPLIVLLALTSLAAWRWRAQPVLIVGWLWFAGTLFPVSGMFQSGAQGMADRFVYVPHLGLLTLLVWGAADLCDALHLPRPVQLGLGLAIVTGMTYLAHEQTKHWHNTETIMEQSIRAVPDNHRAHEILGLYMLEKKNYGAALSLAQRAIRLNSVVASYHVLESQAHARLGNQEEKLIALDRAAHLMEREREQKYMDADAIFRLGEALYMIGKIDEAKKHLEESLRRNPGGSANYTLGLLHFGQGNTVLALELFDRTLQLQPRAHGAWDRKGIALGRLGRWAEAVDCVKKAVEMEPKEPYYRADLAYVYTLLGKSAEARAEYDRVLELDRTWPYHASNRAIRLATHPIVGLRDLGEAMELAEQACQADGLRDEDLLQARARVRTAYQEQRGQP